MVDLFDIHKMDEEDDIEGLILALKEEDEGIRDKAASAIVEKSSPQTLDKLMNMLDCKINYIISQFTLELGEIGDYDSVKLLTKLLNSPYHYVQSSADKSLKKIEKKQNPHIKSIKAPQVGISPYNLSVAEEAEERDQILKMDNFEFDEEEIFEEYNNENFYLELKDRLIHPSSYWGENIIDVLIDELINIFKLWENPEYVKIVTWIAVNLIFGDEILKEINYQKKIMENCEEEAKREALNLLNLSRRKVFHDSDARSIGKVSENVIDNLIRWLDDDSPATREETCHALGLIGDPCVVEPLNKMLKDPNVYVRKKAVNILICLADPRSIEPLICALSDPDWRIREIAATGLGKFGDQRAIKPLVPLILDYDNGIPEAGYAIRNLHKRGYIEECHIIIEPLIRALNDSDRVARQFAAERLSEIADVRSIGHLIKALKDPDEYVRLDASMAIREIDKNIAVEPLIKLLNDPEEFVREEVVLLLGEIGDSRAIDPLNELFLFSEGYIREVILESITRVGGKPISMTYKDPSYLEVKKCLSCGEFEPKYKFYLIGKEQMYCSSCLKEKECISCGEVRPLYQFRQNGIELLRCAHCMDLIKCPSCGREINRYKLHKNKNGKLTCDCADEKKCAICGLNELRYEFFDEGIELTSCRYCREKKKCNMCGEVRPLRAFINDKKELDTCNLCREVKKCIGCGEVKSLSNFNNKEYCNFCMEHIKCEACNQTKERHHFIIGGVQSRLCPSCLRNKKCKCCGEIKPIHKFIIDGNENSFCKHCLEKKECISCGEIKPRSDFYIDGLEKEYCNSCKK